MIDSQLDYKKHFSITMKEHHPYNSPHLFHIFKNICKSKNVPLQELKNPNVLVFTPKNYEFLTKKEYFPAIYSKNPVNLLFSTDQFLSEFFFKSPQRTKYSEYKLQLKNQKKLRLFYGMLSKTQLRKYFSQSSNYPGEFSKNFMSLIERRLDVLLYRSQFVQSIAMAKQMITHKKVVVNQKIISNPSYLANPGDVISLKKLKNFQMLSKIHSYVVRSQGINKKNREKVQKKLHFQEWNFSKKYIAKTQVQFLHLMLAKKIQNQVDDFFFENSFYI